MTTQVKALANRQNALRSTGPKSRRGKEASRTNAATHGLLAMAPTLPGESLKPWHQLRDGIFRDVSPVGAIEKSLTDILILLIWKYRRIMNYEMAVISEKLQQVDKGNATELSLRNNLENKIAEAEQRLAAWLSERQLFALVDQDDQTSVSADQAFHFFESFAMVSDSFELDPHDGKFLTSIGAQVPSSPDAEQDAYDVTEWTVSHLKRGADYIGSLAKKSAAVAIELVRNKIEKQCEAASEEIKQLRKELAKMDLEMEEKLAHLFALHGLPDDETLEKTTRYATTIQRQMISTLHEIQRLQAGRLNGISNIPVAIDISVNTDERENTLLTANQSNTFITGGLKQVEDIKTPLGC